MQPIIQILFLDTLRVNKATGMDDFKKVSWFKIHTLSKIDIFFNKKVKSVTSHRLWNTFQHVTFQTSEYLYIKIYACISIGSL